MQLNRKILNQTSTSEVSKKTFKQKNIVNNNETMNSYFEKNYLVKEFNICNISDYGAGAIYEWKYNNEKFYTLNNYKNLFHFKTLEDARKLLNLLDNTIKNKKV